MRILLDIKDFYGRVERINSQADKNEHILRKGRWAIGNDHAGEISQNGRKYAFDSNTLFHLDRDPFSKPEYLRKTANFLECASAIPSVV